MTTYKRKKKCRYRGSTTHGGGSMKKRRGSGSRGGRGMAGTGKRAGQNKILILKEYGPSYFGKHGFTRPSTVVATIKAINLDTLELKLQNYVSKNLVNVSDGVYEIDLVKLGFQKLLGRGNLTHIVKVKVPMISKAALEKVKKAGGEVIGEDVSTK